jgi:hypothetical protein
MINKIRYWLALIRFFIMAEAFELKYGWPIYSSPEAVRLGFYACLEKFHVKFSEVDYQRLRVH